MNTKQSAISNQQLAEVPLEKKIELMLSIYREKLEKANIPPVDYVAGIRLEGQIDLLENLYYYARQQQPAPAAQEDEI